MFPTRLQVKQRFWALLDDPAGKVFTDAATANGGPSLFQSFFSEAYDILYNSFMAQQVPRVEIVVQGIIVAAGQTSLTPAQAGLNDLADWEWIAERQAGSNDKFIDLVDEDRLTQRAMTDRLLETVWQNGAWQFVGATTVREIQLKYASSGEAPTNDTASIQIDSSLNFLANCAAGSVGGNKGYESIAAKCRQTAVGPKYDLGIIGGQLFYLTQPLVRSRQNVVVAHKPYTTQRRCGYSRGIPYVAAQQGTTGGGAQNVPIGYSSANGGIIGTIDGINTVFFVNSPSVMQMTVYRNGDAQTPSNDYVALNTMITFLAGAIPQPGDTITVEAWVSYA